MASLPLYHLSMLLFVGFLVGSSSTRLAQGQRNANEVEREFGYFVLALLWPGTICQQTKHCCPSNGCCRRSLSTTEFTIHGLWPDYDDGTWPACCSGSNFDIMKVAPLMGKLNKYWPALSCSPSSVCHGGKGLFWAHEWEKHGTCSYPVIKDEYSYFSTTLDLYFKHNITEILVGAGYELTENDNEYLLSDIVTTIKNSVGSSPFLVCSKGAVEELRICFHRDFKPRDCVIGSYVQDAKLEPSSCPRYINLPGYKPHNLLESGNATFQWTSE